MYIIDSISFNLNPEIFAGECLAELPAGGSDVPGGGAAAVAGSHTEGEGLTNQDGIGLPVLTPVARHWHPVGVGTLHAGPNKVASAGHIGDEDQVEVAEAVHGEADPSGSTARHSA